MELRPSPYPSPPRGEGTVWCGLINRTLSSFLSLHWGGRNSPGRSYRLNSIFISSSSLGKKEQSGGAYRLSALSSWGRGNSLGRSYRLNAIGFSLSPLERRNSLVRSYKLNAIGFSLSPLEGRNSLVRSYRLNAIVFSPFPLGGKEQSGAVL